MIETQTTICYFIARCFFTSIIYRLFEKRKYK